LDDFVSDEEDWVVADVIFDVIPVWVNWDSKSVGIINEIQRHGYRIPAIKRIKTA